MANVSLKKDFKNGDKLYDHQLNNNFASIEAALAAMNKIVWQDDEENGASVSTYKGTTEEIEARDLIDGQLLYNTETGETYIDAYVNDVLTRINTGSGNVVAIQSEEPTNDAVKLWVDTDELDVTGTEITDNYSERSDVGYSARYINEALDELDYDISNIVSKGSNTNGSWIQFANGSMICYGNMTGQATELADYYSHLNRTEAILKTLPKTFTEAPTVLTTINGFSGQISTLATTVTVNSFNLTVLKPKDVSDKAYNVNYVAIGRWD